MIRITAVDFTAPRFKRELRAIPPEIQRLALIALQDLVRQPIPKRLRFEKLSGHKNPSIYTVHVTPNHSHKASFELVGTIAVMRRIGTHKEIDRVP